MSKPDHVAIIGGGPGGLLLARMLFLKGVAYTVYERESSSGARLQGGTLDLHIETGQHSLRRAGLFNEFLKFARYEGQHTLLYDKHGTLLDEKPAVGEDRPEIDRRHLREILLNSIPESSVLWGHKLETIKPNNVGSVDLYFEDKDPIVADFVVGADGGWSKVRSLLSEAVPQYVGSTLYELSIENVDKDFPDLSQFVGRGTAFIEGDGKAVIVQRNSNGNVRVYAGLELASDVNNRGSNATTKAEIMSHFTSWCALVLALFDAAGEEVRPWPIYALPIGHRWLGTDHATLIGDAAHLMPPAGEGANLALLDAVDLADALCDSEDINTSMSRFESHMFERGEAAAKRAMAMMSQGVDVSTVLREDAEPTN